MIKKNIIKNAPQPVGKYPHSVEVNGMLYLSGIGPRNYIDNTVSGGRVVRFESEHDIDLHDVIERIGTSPLPPYINREPEPRDKKRYQTIYAKERGAVAAPTTNS